MIQTLEEDLIGWKVVFDYKLKNDDLYIKSKLIELQIPKGALCNITLPGIINGNGKCRAEKAKTTAIYDLKYNDNVDLYNYVTSNFDTWSKYREFLRTSCQPSKAKSIINKRSLYNHISESECYIDKNTIYRIGRYVYPDKFDDATNDACSNGIHFFKSANDAILFGLDLIIDFLENEFRRKEFKHVYYV